MCMYTSLIQKHKNMLNLMSEMNIMFYRHNYERRLCSLFIFRHITTIHIYLSVSQHMKMKSLNNFIVPDIQYINAT